ncbi:MAG: alpha/beta fold hydrolase [Pseudomonadota bacterium]|nr:alpha/beta fold hydrolase [Pseudomonadota bacterium]
MTLTYENTTRLIETKDFRIQINEAGEGHPIFMIHGGGPGATGWSNFSPNFETLSRSYRCILVTMPGWGESSPQTVQTGRDGVEALKQLSEAMGIEKAAYVGNSMGAGASLRFTAEYPERVSHLVTMGLGSPGPGNILQPAGAPEGFRILVEAYEDPSPQNMKRLVRVMCYDPAYASDELAEQRSAIALRFPEHIKNWLEFLRSGPSMGIPAATLAKLPTLAVPTMLIHGRDDRTTHFEASLRMVALLPNSSMVLINRCGHWAQLEHPAQFNRLLNGFVGGN